MLWEICILFGMIIFLVVISKVILTNTNIQNERKDDLVKTKKEITFLKFKYTSEDIYKYAKTKNQNKK